MKNRFRNKAARAARIQRAIERLAKKDVSGLDEKARARVATRMAELRRGEASTP